MVILIQRVRRQPPSPPPAATPARSPYGDSVAATGLIEPSRENVKIASPHAGVVARVMVTVGTKIRTGDPLFQLDDREARARLAVIQGQVESLRASLGVEEAQIADWTDQLERFKRLQKDQVATDDEINRRQFSLQGAQARKVATLAQIEALRLQVEQARVEVDVLTVRAPRDGELLQLNLREGEFAGGNNVTESLMLLGDVDRLQVRAEIDEQNALLVKPGAAAVASLKGHQDLKMSLRFVRIEPYVIPKRNLTGDSAERVDTRVLQVIFEFDRPQFPVYVGQQVDVFIRRNGESQTSAQ